MGSIRAAKLDIVLNRICKYLIWVKGWGKMRYRWKKAFLLLGLLMMCGLSFGCQETAVLYDSEEKAGDGLLGDSGASGPETPEKAK